MDSDQIRVEVERLKKEVDGLDEQRQALDSKIAPKRKELEHWNGILALRATGDGNGSLFSETSSGAKTALNDSQKISDEQTPEYGAKARVLREFILSKNGSGVTMKEIIAEANKISPHTAFAYQFVNRQRRAKPPRLEKRGKRFFATQAMTLG